MIDQPETERPPMHRRRTTMFDGRTMYYYTFGEEADAAAASGDTSADARADDEKPRADTAGRNEEGRDV